MALFDFLKGKANLGQRFLENLRKRLNVYELPEPPKPPPRPKSHYPTLESRRRRGVEAGIPEFLNTGALDDIAFREGEYTTVVSSLVAAVQYFEADRKMMIEYNDGAAVMVGDMSWEEARDFFYAPSHGEWTWTYILVRGPGNKGKTQKPVTVLRHRR